MKSGPDFSHSHASESSSTTICLQAVQAGWGSAEPADPSISEEGALCPLSRLFS